MKKILKFEAEWCGQCKALAPILKRVLENHTDNIRNLPTLVFIKDNIEVGRTSGVLTANALEDKIKEFYA